MTNFVLLVVVTVGQIRELTANYNAEMTLKMDLNKVLYGYSFLNISGKTMENCLEGCLKNCLCMSFQMCRDKPECQLCSSNKYLNPQAMHQRQGCTNYDFGSQTKVGNQQCGHSTVTVFNCCTTSNPCLNGGTCLPPLPNSRKRFRCKYSDGYTAERCEHPCRACRGYTNGSRIPGNYSVLDHNSKPFQVFCDFDKNSSMAWTLIQSFSHDNNAVFNKSPLRNDFPQNQNDPSWLKYRLSKSRMKSIQQDTTKWRFTCRYEIDGLVYTDYLRASNTQLNILTFNNNKCVKVEYINVRGNNCTECTADMRQQNAMLMHFNSFHNNKNECSFKHVLYQKCTKNGKKEHNFGYYACVNPQHRCSSSGEATTQTWFGGET